jgi:hypothetical protein
LFWWQNPELSLANPRRFVAQVMTLGTWQEMLGVAQAIYGAQFFSLISLKALTWFEDGDLPSLPREIKDALRRAAGDVREIPDLRPLPGGVSPAAT